jgi:ABC-type transport system involved in Fe-S cluster assembly fused permease/ATPase subunit
MTDDSRFPKVELLHKRRYIAHEKAKTTIAIAHRLGTIRHADTIVVTNRAMIVEMGQP